MFEVAEDDEGLEIAWGAAPIMRYDFSRPVGRPHWHPIRLPGSPPLTQDRPPDHVHHHGMWLAWKAVDGVNFWEQPTGDDDPVLFGRIEHASLEGVAAGPESAEFAVRNEWRDGRGELHLTERRRTVLHAPEPDCCVVELSFEFRAAGAEAVLDLKRGRPGEFGSYYSGLTVRFAGELARGRLLDSEGRTEADAIFGQRARWCGFSGAFGCDDAGCGIALVDAPSNPRHPPPWWVRNMAGYALIQPSPCYHEPLTVRSGSPLRLKYLAVVHRGPLTPELVARAEGLCRPGRTG